MHFSNLIYILYFLQISSEEVNTMSNEELKETLLDEITFVC